MESHIQNTRSPVPLLLFVLLVAFLALIPILSGLEIPSISMDTSSAEVSSIEVVTFSPHTPGNYTEYQGEEGPEGKAPQPPHVSGSLKIFILSETTRKVVEIRDQAGLVIGKVTWTLSDISSFLDDWTGPKMVWSSKIEVLNGNGGNGLGMWLWKFADRVFYQSGMTRAFIDMSLTESGKTGWTWYHLPEMMGFLQKNVSDFNVLMNDPNLRIWIIQYP